MPCPLGGEKSDWRRAQMRWSRLIVPIVTILLLLFVDATPAAAQESRGFIRQLFIMWLPLVAIIGVWVYFIRKSGAGGKQAQMIERQIAMLDRYIPHMDAMERKLDRIIEVLERRSK